jgi:hypothetical protein
MPALNLKRIFFTGPIKWRALKKSRHCTNPCAAGRKEKRACCAVGNMALFKSIILTLVLQVERKGEPAVQLAIWPSSSLSY